MHACAWYVHDSAVSWLVEYAGYVVQVILMYSYVWMVMSQECRSALLRLFINVSEHFAYIFQNSSTLMPSSDLSVTETEI